MGWDLSRAAEGEKQLDYNPDRRPSDSNVFLDEREDGYLWVYQVKGEGVFCLRAVRDETGALTFSGFSIFTKDEIGPCPNL